MHSRRLSPGCCLQLRSSHCLPGRVYVPWKLPTKTRRGSVQSLILSRGKCSSHVRAESLLTDKTRIHLRSASVRTYTFFTTGIP
jgi:hypothetical protein